MPAVLPGLKILLTVLASVLAGLSSVPFGTFFYRLAQGRRGAWKWFAAGAALVLLAGALLSVNAFPVRVLIKQVEVAGDRLMLLDGDGAAVSQIVIDGTVHGATLINDQGEDRIVVWTGGSGQDSHKLFMYGIDPAGRSNRLWVFDPLGALLLDREEPSQLITISDLNLVRQPDGSNLLEISYISIVPDLDLHGTICLLISKDGYEIKTTE